MTGTRVAGHTIRWYVWAWDGERKERLRHSAAMRGTWGWDAACSCGWETQTGGATRAYVKREVWLHKIMEGDSNE